MIINNNLFAVADTDIITDNIDLTNATVKAVFLPNVKTAFTISIKMTFIYCKLVCNTETTLTLLPTMTSTHGRRYKMQLLTLTVSMETSQMLRD